MPLLPPTWHWDMPVDQVVQNTTWHDTEQRIRLSVAPGYNKHKMKERLWPIGLSSIFNIWEPFDIREVGINKNKRS